MPVVDRAWKTPPGVTARFVLVRHGEPAAYAHGRCYGRLDVRLSYRGREQIRLVARSLRQAPLVAVYTSPLRRAQESAAIVSCSHRIPVSVDERLSEINFGRFEGKTYDEVAESHPELYRAWMDRPTEVEFPGGESFDAMERRVLTAAADLRLRHRGQAVAIVTHGGVNRILLCEALGMPKESMFRVDQSYAAVSLIDYYQKTPVVRVVNVGRGLLDGGPGC